MKQQRLVSFLVVLVAYAVSTFASIVVYRFLRFDAWLNVLIVDVMATIIVFLFSLLYSNSSIYDPYWSVQPLVITLGLMIQYGFSVSGLIITITIFLWGLRLTANWIYTFTGFDYEDWRYKMLKEKTGKAYPLVNFFGIHLFPTLVVFAVTMPAINVIVNSAPFNAGVAVFCALSVGATTMQGIADVQMHKFRKQKSGTFIRNGLWKYSRHPNYLGEICMWWGIAFACLCAIPSAWYLIFGALVNTLMFLFISVPMQDKRQSRKQGFSEYKASTRMLLPIYKKQPALKQETNLDAIGLANSELDKTEE